MHPHLSIKKVKEATSQVPEYLNRLEIAAIITREMKLIITQYLEFEP